MKKEYKTFWKVFFIIVGSVVLWEGGLSAMVRRVFFAPPAIAEGQRTESHYIAVVFPKITKKAEPFTVSRADFEGILKGLKTLKYTTISLRDVHDLHVKQRLLPPRSVLLILDRDDPRGVDVADAAMRKFRMRGAIALSGNGKRTGRYKRQWLSRHAAELLEKGGAWDFGRANSSLEGGPTNEFAFDTPSGEFRFSVGKTGFNDDRQQRRQLSAIQVRGGRPAQEALYMIHSDQPRTGEFVDRFAKRTDQQWIAGWGAVAASKGKLILVPTPRHSGAAAFLTGTEGWRDLVLEFELERYKKGFWAYARYKDADHYVRVGIAGDSWVIQQRTGPLTPPSVLGRAPVSASNLPAKVKLVLKGDSALLYINGTMQLGKSFRIDPVVDRGRVQLGVYDKEPRAAMAVLTYVRAKPLGKKWIAVRTEDLESVVASFREEAVEAGAFSPQWVRVGRDGKVSTVDGDRDVLWSFAGYYRAKVLPLVDVAAATLNDKLAEDLAAQAESLEVAGLNLMLSAAQGKKAGPFLAGLANKLRAQQRQLWVTLDGDKVPEWLGDIDGILKRTGRPAAGLETLEISGKGVPKQAQAKAGQEAAL